MHIEDELMVLILLGVGVALPLGSFIIFFVSDFISFLRTGKFRSRE